MARDAEHSIAADDYWVTSCRQPVADGQWETFNYFLRPQAHPTLERARWRFEFPAGTSETTSDSVFQDLRALVIQRFGDPADMDSVLGTPQREFGWREGTLFETHWGPIWVYLIRRQGSPGEELIADRVSLALRGEMASVREGRPEITGPGWEVARSRAVRRELADTLESSRPGLARALRGDLPSNADLSEIGSALEAARALRPDAVRRDLLLLAVHRWLTWMQDTAEPDSMDRVLREIERRGVPLMRADFDTSTRAYCNSILVELAERAGANRWVDEAFAEWLERGMPTSCECVDFAARKVVAAGEVFLRDHPASPAIAAVERAVAEAHENLWSMAKLPLSSKYFDPANQLESAPSHAMRALTLYRDVIRRAPPGWNLNRLRRRVARMEMGVDTAQRAFVCSGD